MDSQIELVKSKTDIVDFIGSYIQLKKAGKSYKANCPFHSEKSPSFVVSAERQLWHCFGACHEGGDVISFLMKWENITFYEALKDLAQKAGITLQSVGFEDKEWNAKEKIMRLNLLAADFYEYILHNTKFGEKAMAYLTGRGLNAKIIKTFKIGYAPASWDSLMKFLKKKGFSDDEVVDTGLAVRGNYARCYDRFRGRIMFPILDIRGNIIGFSGRLLEKDDTGAKYVNTPETQLYHKRESLYGIYLAKDAIRKMDNALLVEGEFDMIMPFQHGVDNVVAIKGSAVTREQLAILKRLTKRITLALDADAAGEDAVLRGIREAEMMDFDINVVEVTNGKDPDESVRNDHVAFKKAIANPVPVYDFLISLSVKKHGDKNPYAKKEIGDEVLPYISRIANPIVQSYYVKKVAAILEVSEDSVEKMIRKIYRDRKLQQRPFAAAAPQQSAPQTDRRTMIERFIVTYILQGENPFESLDTVMEFLTYDDFTIPSLGKICKALGDFRSTNPGQFDITKFVETLPAELRPVCDELYLSSIAEAGQSQGLQRIVLDIKKSSLKKKISDMLGSDATEGSETSIAQLTEQLSEVEKRLNSL